MKDRLQTPLARVRGLGSAKEGSGHWWHQRLTALALIPLSLIFVFSVIFLISSDNEREVAIWLSSPFFATTMLLALFALFYHAKLGMRVIIEDYVHSHCLKSALLALSCFVMIALALASMLAVIKMHLGFQLFI